MSSKTPRDYQESSAQEYRLVLLRQKLLYMAWEVRTGKTATALRTAQLLQGEQPNNQFKVLFITKKTAIGSINRDYEDFGMRFKFVCINYESNHKIDMREIERFDVVIIDEAHKLGMYPKPTKYWTELKGFIDEHTYVILLSGTPAAESQSQLFHQLTISPHSPWRDYKNFYSWAREFVTVKQVNHGAGMVNDYSVAKTELVQPHLDGVMFIKTQKECKIFNQTVKENVLWVKMSTVTESMVARLLRDRVIVGKDPTKTIVADTSVKLQQKLHQLCSGTIKFDVNDDGEQESMTIDNSKAIAIQKKFKGKQIAILYQFIQEGVMLEETFPNFTRDWEEFERDPSRPFLGQIRSKREGISLWKADALIYFNIDFSAVSYLQGRDRLTKQERTVENNVWFVQGDHEDAIEPKIYDRVIAKEDYHNKLFRSDYNIVANWKDKKADPDDNPRRNRGKKGTAKIDNQIGMFT